MGQTNETSKQINSVKTSFEIIRCLQKLKGATLTEVSDALNLHKSTAYVHLNTLVEERLVLKKDGEYYVSLLFLDLGTKERSNRTIYNEVKPKMRRLAEETEERVQFMVEEHGRGIYLHRVRGETGIIASNRIGVCRYLHSSSAGKAILAQYDNDRISEIVERWGLPKQTSKTITDLSSLSTELDDVRDQGYAINKEEHIEGLWALGAPITDQHNNVLGALSISGPKQRFDNERKMSQLQDQILGIINEVELDIRG